MNDDSSSHVSIPVSLCCLKRSFIVIQMKFCKKLAQSENMTHYLYNIRSHLGHQRVKVVELGNKYQLLQI